LGPSIAIKTTLAIIKFLVFKGFLEIRELRELHRSVCEESTLKVVDFDQPKFSGNIIKKRQKEQEKRKKLPIDEEKSCDAIGITTQYVDFIEMGRLNFTHGKMSFEYYNEELFAKVNATLNVLRYLLTNLAVQEVECFVTKEISVTFRKKLKGNELPDSENIYTGIRAYRELKKRLFLVVPAKADTFEEIVKILAASSSKFMDSPNYPKKLAEEFGFEDGNLLTCEELEELYSREGNLLEKIAGE